MPGFFVCDSPCGITLKNLYPDTCTAEELTLPGKTVKRATLRKFLNDKAFGRSDRGIAIGEGVLLNKQELFDRYGADTVEELLWKMYAARGERFAEELRGPYSCALYAAASDRWLVYTNHTGESPVFYLLRDGIFCAGSQINYILDACRERGIALSFDERAAYELLTLGFLESDRTCAREIRRLCGGTYLRVEHGVGKVCEYHRFRKDPERFAGRSEDEMIEEFDAAFRRAVALEYGKDEEYGLRHLTDMSGGLDTRMGAWVSHVLAPRQLQLITYCRAGYLDEIIAKEIAEYWHDRLLVKALDDASFLYDIDETVFLLGGTSIYSGITGGKHMLESLNMSRFGLEHTGQIGGGVLGSPYHSMKDHEGPCRRIYYSGRLANRLEDSGWRDHFEDNETYLIHTRSLRGANNTSLLRRNYTEPVSPFAEADALQLIIDIPVEYRVGHEFYKKWILAKYPEAAGFRWENIVGKITDPPALVLAQKVLYKGKGKLMSRLGRPEYDTFNMNPMDHWFSRRADIRSRMDEYAKKGFELLPGDVSDTLVSDMKEMYEKGSTVEKTMVLTVLGAAKLIFSAQA